MTFGVLDVEAMLAGMSARRFAGWEAYASVEPFGMVRDDYHFARLLQMLYNVNRGKKDKALSAEDFLIKFEEAKPRRKQTWKEQQRIVAVLAKMHAAMGINT